MNDLEKILNERNNMTPGERLKMKININSYYGSMGKSFLDEKFMTRFTRKAKIDKIFNRDGLLGGESISYESSNIIKMKVTPLRCRWRKNSIKKIYGI